MNTRPQPNISILKTNNFICLLQPLFLVDSFSSRKPVRRSGWLGRPQSSSPSITPHKSNKTRLCKYFSGFSTSSRVLLLAVCQPQSQPLCGPWWLFCLVLLDVAALLLGGSRACMHAVAEGRISLELFTVSKGLPSMLGLVCTAHTFDIIYFCSLQKIQVKYFRFMVINYLKRCRGCRHVLTNTCFDMPP